MEHVTELVEEVHKESVRALARLINIDRKRAAESFTCNEEYMAPYRKCLYNWNHRSSRRRQEYSCGQDYNGIEK